MYKCGWNGCEKAYGTLNHLNAHVTMQSHGQKRTPEGMSISLCFATRIFFSFHSIFYPCARYASQYPKGYSLHVRHVHDRFFGVLAWIFSTLHRSGAG